MAITQMLRRHKSTIVGLDASLQSLQDNITAEEVARQGADGDLTALSTTAKTSLVEAINEVQASASGAITALNDYLRKDDNLASLVDAAAARTNLDVPSNQEVTDAIDAAKLALGTNHTVADLTARDALSDLDLADRVFVSDVGDGTWAQFKPETIDGGTGAVTAWTQLTSQSAFEASNSASAIKTAYESNADTNAFTDAEKAKLGLVSATQAADLDDAVYKAGLVQDLSSPVVDAAQKVASIEAMKAYVEAAAASATQQTSLETLTVASGEITLTNAPQGGRAGIHNFGMVRFVDTDGSFYDIPVSATADSKVFAIGDTGTLTLEGKDVHVQYTYAAYDAFNVVWPTP